MSPNDQPKPDLQYCPTHGARVPRGGRSHFGVTWRTSSQCAGTFHTFPVSNWCIGGGRACLRGALRPPASCGAGMVAASSKLDDPSGSERDSSSEGPPPLVSDSSEEDPRPRALSPSSSESGGEAEPPSLNTVAAFTVAQHGFPSPGTLLQMYERVGDAGPGPWASGEWTRRMNAAMAEVSPPVSAELPPSRTLLEDSGIMRGDGGPPGGGEIVRAMGPDGVSTDPVESRDSPLFRPILRRSHFRGASPDPMEEAYVVRPSSWGRHVDPLFLPICGCGAVLPDFAGRLPDCPAMRMIAGRLPDCPAMSWHVRTVHERLIYEAMHPGGGDPSAGSSADTGPGAPPTATPARSTMEELD
jgi:hypothetical protein